MKINEQRIKQILDECIDWIMYDNDDAVGTLEALHLDDPAELRALGYETLAIMVEERRGNTMEFTREDLLASKVLIVIRNGMVEDVFLNDKGIGCLVIDYDNYDFDEIHNYEEIVDEIRQNQKMQNIY